jgi:hypothetical protein
MPAIQTGRPRATASKPATAAGALTGGQKAAMLLGAVLCGPAVLKKFYDKPASEKVDLSTFNIVTSYDTPAIEKMDSTLRIEFCSS